MPAEDRRAAKEVAVVGLGNMGRGIARNLDRSGVLYAAFDSHTEAFAAAEFSDRVMEAGIAQILEEARVILFVVPSCAQIETILAGFTGRQGQVIIDLTTSDPVRSRALAADLAARGFAYVDAAMTGGAAGADAGTLTLMVGGEDGVVASCSAPLDVISSRRFHLGPGGSGHAMKLVHNMILHSSFLATCEGLRLAERAGLDLDRAVEVLNAGNARSYVTEVRFPRDILSGSMMARSHIGNLEKDLGLAEDFAASLDARIPYGKMTRTVLAQALASGHGSTDFSHLFPLYEELINQLRVEK
ncbi:MAG: NAD(P)-dependent oxidoreductase [Hoeflea sp.]|uniref:NAD(P)-dependent oxidoreductase n=1 Tax=Hoeflea sp. TaxID=1940281 RepID=UPI003EF8662B